MSTILRPPTAEEANRTFSLEKAHKHAAALAEQLAAALHSDAARPLRQKDRHALVQLAEKKIAELQTRLAEVAP